MSLSMFMCDSVCVVSVFLCPFIHVACFILQGGGEAQGPGLTQDQAARVSRAGLQSGPSDWTSLNSSRKTIPFILCSVFSELVPSLVFAAAVN